MATSAITTPRTHAAFTRAALAHLARIVARGTLHLAAACLPLLFAAWLVYPMSPAGAALAGVVALLAGVGLGAWLAAPVRSTGATAGASGATYAHLSIADALAVASITPDATPDTEGTY